MKLSDLAACFLIVTGCTLLLAYSAKEMGRDEGRREVTADHFERIPSWASSCRLNPDGTKECKAYGPMMKRSNVEWKRMAYFQERLGRTK